MADIRSKTAPAQYIYLDIVGYSKDRTVEAQTEIVETLNRIVLSALEMYKISRRKYIPIPTGDGICIALLDVQEPFDVALLISIYILHNVVASNEKQKEKMREFAIRIGINENTDNLVKDISGKKNIAGAGITYSQRIMDLADPNQILVGRTVFEKLHQREKSIIPPSKSTLVRLSTIRKSRFSST